MLGHNADDALGNACDNFCRELQRVRPNREPVELPLEHQIFSLRRQRDVRSGVDKRLPITENNSTSETPFRRPLTCPAYDDPFAVHPGDSRSVGNRIRFDCVGGTGG